MASESSILAKAARHPFSFAVLVLSFVILLVWYDLRKPTDQNQAPIGESDALSKIELTPPDAINSNRSQPKVLENLSAGERQSAAGAIGDLVGRLEAKVKADQ